MKNTLILFKLYVPSCLGFILFVLTGCGDAEPIINSVVNHDPILVKPIVHDKELVSKLKDTMESIEGITFTPDQLNEVAPELATFSGTMTMYAFPGRSQEKTRPILIFSQSLFGEDLSHPLHDYILSLDDETKAKNSFIVISALKSLPDTTSFMLTKGRSSLKADANTQQVTIKSYKDITNYALDLFTEDPITELGDLGKLKYINKGKGSVFVNTALEIKKSLNIIKDDLHFNTQKAALVTFDPFISTLLFGITGQNDPIKSGKITHIAAVPVILDFTTPGKNYPDYETDLDESYLNLGYKIDLVDINNSTNTNLKKKLAFDILRVVPESFFLSMVVLDLNSNYPSNRATIVKGIEFYIALSGDKATDTATNLKGQKLILDDNVTNRKIGLYSKIDNPQKNLKTTTILLSGPDYNFPGNNQDANKLIGGTNGLVKYIVDQAN